MEAVLTLSGAIIGAVIGFVASWLTLKYNYKKLFSETVSHSRMEWINAFREDFAIVIGTALNNAKCDRRQSCEKCQACERCQTCEKLLAAEQARVRLLTRLNMHTERTGNEYNKVFAERLTALPLCGAKKGITNEDIEKLIELARKILEPEWQRVKNEAKGEQR